MRSRLGSFAVVTTLVAGLFTLTGDGARAEPPTRFEYVTMADGVKIAVSVNFPIDYSGANPRLNPFTGGETGWPTLLQMDGYGGGGDEVSTSRYDEKYVTVYASVRGTGCSGGRFDLFDRIHAEDGKTIIDQWLTDPANAPWFNGDVGIVGHSYPGLTGWMVTSTQPAQLDAAALSGEIDDLYRGIVYPGGVPNYGFPAEWTLAFRPALEQIGNADRYVNETAGGDPTCAANIATRTADQNTVLGAPDHPVVQGLTSQEDDTWYQVRSTVSYVDRIDVPMHLTQQWQDEQTGPRGSNRLFELLDVPKRLVLTNGVHATNSIAQADRNAWLDCWLYGNGDASDAQWCGGGIIDPAQRVRIHFETGRNGQVNAPYVSSDWPLPEAEWTELYLTADGSLTETAPGANEPPSSYLSTTAGRQVTGEPGLAGGGAIGDTGGQAGFSDGPDQLVYEHAFAGDTAVAGPINLTLKASSSATDADFFVDVLDVSPDGEVSYLQRGMQRASHRQLDPLRSDRVKAPNPAAGTVYRYHHPHTNTTLNVLTPTVPETFQIEVFPVGHVFREGHTLRIQVHAPPPDDPLSIYAWYSARPPAVNTVFHADGASKLLVPVIPASAVLPVPATPPACGALVGVPCFTPVDTQIGQALP